MFHIFSLYFLQVFFQFSPTFPNDETELFPSSPVDGFLQEGDWQDFLLQGMLPVQKFISRLHDFCVNRSCTLLWQHLIWHLVCVCVRVSGWISQPYIVLCPVSKHKLAEMPQQDRFLWMTPLNSCKNNGWDGETELSSHAPARPQTARLKHVRHIETPRSAKHEANNRLYKIQPLRQQKAIAIWPSASEHGYSIHETKRHSLDFTLRRALWSTAFQRSLFILLVPTAILQSQGFWQHKGLGKHINTYYDFGCACHPDLQRIGNTEKARLFEVDVYLGCFNWRQRRIDCLKMSINLLSSLQTALLRTLSDDTFIHPNHELIAHVADKETLLINCHDTF